MPTETGAAQDLEALFQSTIEAMQGPDADRAYALASELCQAAPQHFDHQQMAGLTALSANRPAEATEHFRQAVNLAEAPRFSAVAWCGLAHAHFLMEDPRRAEAGFRRALAIAHEFPPALAGLTEVLAQEGRFDEAVQAGLRARELGIKQARTETALGHAYLGQGKLDDAEAAFRRALELDPEATDPQYALGTIAKFNGRMDEAMRIYRSVLEKAPEFPGYGQLVDLKTFTPDDPDLKNMEARYAAGEQRWARRERSDLCFALAKAYDDLGETDKAVQCLEEGNRLERESIRHDPEEFERRAERIRELFTREFIERVPDGGMVGISPLFVVSLPRSGSTLLEQMLSSHSGIRGGGELGHFVRVATALSLKWGSREDFPDIDPTAAGQDLRESAREYARLTAPLRLLQPHFTDKSLQNFQYVGLIRMMLPDARIIHVRRHPLATAFGVYRQRFARGLGFSFSLEHIVRHYRAYADLMEHWRQTVPGAFIEVHHEALLAEPERELQRIFDYAGLEYEPAALAFYRTERPVRTASSAQVRRPLESRGLHRHEAYGELLAHVTEALAADIRAYEEELSKAGIDMESAKSRA
jgi:tetratricopeptide (TPR) repeat protein